MKPVFFSVALLAVFGLVVAFAYGTFSKESEEETVVVVEEGEVVIEEVEVTEVDLVLGLNEVSEAFDAEFVVTEVVEDSRCPIDVDCIQAGTVRVRIESRPAGHEAIITLGESVSLGEYEVEFLAVRPDPVSTSPIQETEYEFTFEVRS